MPHSSVAFDDGRELHEVHAGWQLEDRSRGASNQHQDAGRWEFVGEVRCDRSVSSQMPQPEAVMRIGHDACRIVLHWLTHFCPPRGHAGRDGRGVA